VPATCAPCHAHAWRVVRNPRHRHQEFLSFLRRLDGCIPEPLDVHLRPRQSNSGVRSFSSYIHKRAGNRRVVKELEKAKKRLATKLKERSDRKRKDSIVTFEELGIDQVFVDEADLYKNLFYTTKMNRIVGLPNSDCNGAFDMFLKTRYLAPSILRERGLEHFDAWAGNVAEAVTSLELAPAGSGHRMHTRFAKFVNLPELQSIFPHGRRARRASAHATHRPVPGQHAQITGDGRRAALDMRLVEAFAEPHSDTKLSRAIDRIHDVWQQTTN